MLVCIHFYVTACCAVQAREICNKFKECYHRPSSCLLLHSRLRRIRYQVRLFEAHRKARNAKSWGCQSVQKTTKALSGAWTRHLDALGRWIAFMRQHFRPSTRLVMKGMTALHIAADSYRTEAMGVLVSLGGDLNARAPVTPMATCPIPPGGAGRG